MVVSTNRPKLTNILSGVAIYGGVFVRSGHKVCRTDAFSVRYAHRWSNFNLQAKVKRNYSNLFGKNYTKITTLMNIKTSTEKTETIVQAE